MLWLGRTCHMKCVVNILVVYYLYLWFLDQEILQFHNFWILVHFHKLQCFRSFWTQKPHHFCNEIRGTSRRNSFLILFSCCSRYAAFVKLIHLNDLLNDIPSSSTNQRPVTLFLMIHHYYTHTDSSTCKLAK